jgi:hypothetical protein
MGSAETQQAYHLIQHYTQSAVQQVNSACHNGIPYSTQLSQDPCISQARQLPPAPVQETYFAAQQIRQQGNMAQ